MNQQIGFDAIPAYARFDKLSARRKPATGSAARRIEARNDSRNKEVARLMIGLAACMFLAMSVGVAMLLVKLPV